MWTYDSYFRDFRFFLILEVALLGLVFGTLTTAPDLSPQTYLLLTIAVLTGIVLSALWAGRQRREHTFARARLKELQRLEEELGQFQEGAFEYHTEVIERAREELGKEGAFVPLFGTKRHILPNFFQKSLIPSKFYISRTVSSLMAGNSGRIGINRPQEGLLNRPPLNIAGLLL